MIKKEDSYIYVKMNTNFKKIAIIIKTAPNRKSLLWLLNSIEISLSGLNYRIYLGDERLLNDWKVDLYQKLEEEGHYIHIWDEPIAVTVARNHLIDHLQDEKYVLRVDDDFELGGEFDIHALLTILEKNRDIDFCCDIERQIGSGKGTKSGDIRIESGFVKFNNKKPPTRYIKRDGSWRFNTIQPYRFAKADYMRNLIMLKRHCFNKVKWNENLFFSGEHIDFFLSLKKAGYQGAFTPDSIHLHRDDIKYVSIDYEVDQKWKAVDTKEVKLKEFNKKWGGLPQQGFVKDLYKSFLGKIKKK